MLRINALALALAMLLIVSSLGVPRTSVMRLSW